LHEPVSIKVYLILNKILKTPENIDNIDLTLFIKECQMLIGNKMYLLTEQNDITEFFLLFLQIGSQPAASKSITNRKDAMCLNFVEKANSFYTSHLFNESPLSRSISFQLVTQIRCLLCSKKRTLIDHLHILSLQVNQNLQDSMEELFKPVTQREWKCECCKKQTECTISKKITKMPRVLVISLSKSNSDQKDIFFPSSLHIGKYLFPSISDDVSYFLSSIACREEPTYSGQHYTITCGEGNIKRQPKELRGYQSHNGHLAFYTKYIPTERNSFSSEPEPSRVKDSSPTSSTCSPRIHFQHAMSLGNLSPTISAN
jgi:ubiquitin C-terminal hydrolase